MFHAYWLPSVSIKGSRTCSLRSSDLVWVKWSRVCHALVLLKLEGYLQITNIYNCLRLWIRHLHISLNALYFPQKFCISIVFSFSWDSWRRNEKQRLSNFFFGGGGANNWQLLDEVEQNIVICQWWADQLFAKAEGWGKQYYWSAGHWQITIFCDNRV